MSTINNIPVGKPDPGKQPEPWSAHRMGGYQDRQDWEDSELGKGKGDPAYSDPPYEKPSSSPKVSSGGLEKDL